MDDPEIIRVYDLAYRDDIPVVRAETIAIRAVFDAGVVEGIRQARDAVVDGYWQYEPNLNAALDRIDALGDEK